MKINLIHIIVFLTAVSLGITGVFAWNRHESGSDGSSEGSRIAGGTFKRSLPSSTQGRQSDIPKSDKNQLASPEVSIPRLAATDIDSLVASGSAQAALSAFAIIDRCFQLEKNKGVIASLPPSDENNFIRKQNEIESAANDTYCKSVSQRQFADRTQLLEKAVAGRVPGAANAFFAAGPNGVSDDLYYRADDPGVIAWKATAISYLKRDANMGDVNALAQLSSVFSGQFGESRDISQALGYELALREVRKQSGVKNLQSMDASISLLQSQATESEISAASAIAKLVIDNCCKKN